MAGGTVLILGGSGKIGTHCRAAFAAAGWNVRVFDRRRQELKAEARGADLIVNGFNPAKYHNWARLIPAITRDVTAAAKVSGATVIIPGNVYNFGDQGGEWSEHTPQRPNTRKGRIRVEMEAAYQASGVQTVVLRAGNFIDPDGNGDVMSLLFLRDLERGKLTIAGGPQVIQAYCYVPDWARAAVELAERCSTLSVFEDIPFPGHAFSAEQLRVFLSEELDRPLEFSKLPWWFFSLLSPFWELSREMLEMRYLWNTPHTLSGEKFGRLLPSFRATPLDQVMRAGLRDHGKAHSPATS